jgi:RimJ/RimL family protein N-acetyltransferase
VGVILQALLLDIPEELETERLWLRATRAGGGALVQAGLEESIVHLRPWMPWARNDQVLVEAEKHCREQQARWHARQELDFMFLRKADGFFVGKGGLHTIDWMVPKLEIGYWIRTSCTRQGFATEATRAMVALARDRLGARRLEITSDTRNGASRRVAEKCGFTLEGVLRSSRRGAAGELADSCMYARVFPE